MLAITPSTNSELFIDCSSWAMDGNYEAGTYLREWRNWKENLVMAWLEFSLIINYSVIFFY